MWLLWKLGVVDTFSFFKFSVNAAAQYSGVVKDVVINNLNPVPIVGWGIFSIALISVLGIGGLALFQQAERNHYSYTYLNINKQDFIDVTDYTT